MNESCWIPLKEETPPRGVGVLVTDGTKVYCAERDEFNGYAYWLPIGIGGPEWEWEYHTSNITHWMPLPSLPTATDSPVPAVSPSH